MATYGMEVKDSTGGVIFDSTKDSGWTLIDSWVAPDTGNRSVTYDDWAGYTIIGCGIVGGSWAGHHISTSGTTVTATRIVVDSVWINTTNATLVLVFVR